MRKLNSMKLGFVDNQVKCNSNGLYECIEKGKKYIDWDNKLKEYQNQTGPIRRGVGMSMFSFSTGVYPISLETACL